MLTNTLKAICGTFELQTTERLYFSTKDKGDMMQLQHEALDQITVFSVWLALEWNCEPACNMKISSQFKTVALLYQAVTLKTWTLAWCFSMSIFIQRWLKKLLAPIIVPPLKAGMNPEYKICYLQYFEYVVQRLAEVQIRSQQPEFHPTLRSVWRLPSISLYDRAGTEDCKWLLFFKGNKSEYQDKNVFPSLKNIFGAV